jgi:hypothetical protein
MVVDRGVRAGAGCGVAVGGVVHAAVIECAGAVSCGTVIVREDQLDLTIE